MRFTTHIRVARGATGAPLLISKSKRFGAIVGMIGGRSAPLPTVEFELTVVVPDKVFDGIMPGTVIQAEAQHLVPFAPAPTLHV